jgi:hypothetical protein
VPDVGSAIVSVVRHVDVFLSLEDRYKAGGRDEREVVEMKVVIDLSSLCHGTVAVCSHPASQPVLACE